MQQNKAQNYNEFYVALGKKIKEKRKALKLSQADVCGDVITRNMLSRIECGAAHPSLDTLIFLSERLKTPLEYFVCRNEASEALYKKTELIKEIRKLYSLKHYKKCLNYCKNLTIDDEEINFIVTECEFAIADENMKLFKLATAEKYLEACELSSKKSIYAQNKFKASVKFYRQLLENLRSGSLPDESLFKDNSLLSIGKEFYLFVFSLSTSSYLNNDKAALSVFSEYIFKSYIEAKLLIHEKDYKSAITLLHNIMNSSPDFFTAYFTVQDLELCYKETDDFKKAYEYANVRLDLLEQFNT